MTSLADSHRMEVLSDAGCLPCMIDGWWAPAEIHHVLASQYRHDDEHRHTYPVCAWHHRGVPPLEIDVDIGPSMARAPAEYRRRYGQEDDLIQIADAVLRTIDGAARRHEYLPQHKLIKIVGLLYSEIVQHRIPHPAIINRFA